MGRSAGRGLPSIRSKMKARANAEAKARAKRVARQPSNGAWVAAEARGGLAVGDPLPPSAMVEVVIEDRGLARLQCGLCLAVGRKGSVASLGSSSSPIVARVAAGPLSCRATVLGSHQWLPEVLAEIGEARTVTICSYVFDHAELQRTLLHRLNGRAPFKCQLLVDVAGVSKKVCRHGQARLKALQDAGAEVLLCSGSKSPRYGPQSYAGLFHAKILLINDLVAYVGSANATENAMKNVELMVRLAGPPVRDISAAVATLAGQGKTLI